MSQSLRCSLAFALLVIGCATPIETGAFIRNRVEPLPPMPESAQRSNITFRTADNTILRGWFMRKPRSTRTVLLFHGNGEGILSSMWSIQWLADAFDADVLALDARGFGFSDGTPSIDGSIADSLSLYDELRELDPKHRPIVVMGQSMGTASAIHVAANRQADLLVLLSPFSSLNDVLDAYRDKLPWYVHLRVDKSLSEVHSSPTRDLLRVTAPTLIVRGKSDALITEAAVGRVNRACNAKVKEVCSVKGVHEDVHPTNSEVRACIQRFAARTLPAAASTTAMTPSAPPVPLTGDP
jgi:alpha-beta hydrolase superfamily lysophospholipase